MAARIGRRPGSVPEPCSGTPPGSSRQANPGVRCDPGRMSEPAPPPAWQLPVPRRDSGRLLGGVCVGVAEHFGVNVTLLRVGFAVLAANGVGVLLYVALWLLMPAAADSPPPLAAEIFADLLPRPGSHRRQHAGSPSRHPRRVLIAYALLGVALGSALGATGIGLGRSLTLPLTL